MHGGHLGKPAQVFLGRLVAWETRMTARKIFGTDGIRGQANSWPITPEMAMRLGMAAATYFRQSGENRRRLVVIGKDTRLSGYMLEPALTAGFTAMGMDVDLFGPLADAGCGAADAQPARRPWGDDLGLAQPLLRQRHQAVRARRPQAVG